jgi:arylsulfatase A
MRPLQLPVLRQNTSAHTARPLFSTMPSHLVQAFLPALVSAAALAAAVPAAAAQHHLNNPSSPSLSPSPPAQQQAPPNILLILADDLGYGEIQAVWPQQPHILTPNLVRFASQGTVFTDAYAGAPQCTPSRTSLLTGKTLGAAPLKMNRGSACGAVAGTRVYGTYDDPQPQGTCDGPVTDGGSAPPTAVPSTIPTVLRQAGYRSLHFGKWMLGEPNSTSTPQGLGFDASFGTLDGANGWHYWPSFQFHFNSSLPPSDPASHHHVMVPLPGNDDQVMPAGKEWLCKSVFNASGHPCTYNQDVYASLASDFLASPAAREQPFFMFLAFHLPHANDGVETNNSYGWGQPTESDAPYTDSPWPQVEKNHAAMVTHLDALVGQVLDALDASGLADTTLVVFASDNGASNEGGHDYLFHNSSGPLRGAKGCTWEGGFREPTIVRWPGKVADGRRSAYPWAYFDLLPTFAEAAGLNTSSLPAGIQGTSVLPTWLGTESQPDRLLYWKFGQQCEGPTPDYNPPRVFPSCCDYALAARLGDWKVRWWSDPSIPAELYNLTADLHEDVDLAGEHPDVVKALVANATALYDVEDPMWPTVPCSTGKGPNSPQKLILCEGQL